MAKRTDNENLISNPDILFKYSVDILVVMSVLLSAGFYLNGFNALKIAFFSIITAVLSEDIACKITKKTDKKAQDLFAAATGLAIALMLPATVPAYIAVIASAFAVIAVLVPFGGARKVPFVPAAAGICFATLCFPKAVFTYAPVNALSSSPVYGSESFIAGESFSSMLRYGKSIMLNPLESIYVLMGNIPGPMGTTCILVIFAAAIYMLIKRKEDFIITVSFFAACALYAAVFPRVNSGVLTSVVMELSSGMLAFAAIILLPCPFTAPQKTLGKIFYGIIAGIVCMALRRYGTYEESVCFTVLIMNAVSPAFGDYFEIFTGRLKEKGLLKERKPVFAEIKTEKPKKEKVKKEKQKKENPVKEKPKAINRNAQKTDKKSEQKSENNKQARKEKNKITKSNSGKNKPVNDKDKTSTDYLSYDSLMNFDDDLIESILSDEPMDKEGENGNG